MHNGLRILFSLLVYLHFFVLMFLKRFCFCFLAIDPREIKTIKTYLFDTKMLLPLWARVYLGAMVMKGYSTLPSSPELLPHHQMQLSVIPRTLVRFSSSYDGVKIEWSLIEIKTYIIMCKINILFSLFTIVLDMLSIKLFGSAKENIGKIQISF